MYPTPPRVKMSLSYHSLASWLCPTLASSSIILGFSLHDMSGILECLPQPEHSIAAEWHGSSSRHQAEDPSSAEASHNGSCHREHVKFSSAMDSHSVVASTPNKPEGTQGFWLWQLLPSSASDASQNHESVSVQQNDVTPQQPKVSDSETAENLTGYVAPGWDGF